MTLPIPVITSVTTGIIFSHIHQRIKPLYNSTMVTPSGTSSMTIPLGRYFTSIHGGYQIATMTMEETQRELMILASSGTIHGG